MGIEFVSTIQESNFQFSVVYNSATRKTRYENKRDWGVGLYLLHNAKDGFYSHNDFSRSTSSIVDIANHLLRSSSPSQNNQFEKIVSNKLNPERQISVIDISDRGPWNAEPEVQMNEYLRVLKSILDKYLNEINYSIDISGKSVNKSIQNSMETNIMQIFEVGTINIDIFLKNNQNIPITLEYGGIQGSDLNIDFILEDVHKQLYDLANLNNAKKLKPDSYEVVLSPDTAYSLIHESIGHGVEADQVVNNSSFLTNRLGFKVASSELTITDDPHLRGVGWSEYDDEGTKTTGTLLVEDGILVDYLHTNKTSKLLDSLPTGNARSTSYYQKPEPRQTNLFVEPKENSFQEILEDVKNGVLLGPTHVASTSLFSGNIEIEVQYGRMIRNGELREYLNPISLKGNALELLRNVNLVGDEIIKHPTQCLKLRSKIDIGAYTPYMSMGEVFLE